MLAETFDFSLKKDPEKIRGVWAAPLATLIFPGADQWVEGQTVEASTFSGLALSGLVLGTIGRQRVEDQRSCYNCNSTPYRLRDLGYQSYLAAGGYSAYYAFRSAVKQRKEKLSEYEFLKKEDSEKDILLAPFNVSFLTRWTTLLPLALVAFSSRTQGLRGDDAFFAGGTSYYAGTWEESFFRGYLMPAMRQGTGSTLAANFMSSSIFAAAHLPNHKKGELPLGEFLLGSYFAWLVPRNDWSITEGVFIHFWWDALIFISDYSKERKDRHLMIYLPLFMKTF